MKFLERLDPGDTWRRSGGKIGVPGEHGDSGEAQQLCRPHDRGELLRAALMAQGMTVNCFFVVEALWGRIGFEIRFFKSLQRVKLVFGAAIEREQRQRAHL